MKKEVEKTFADYWQEIQNKLTITKIEKATLIQNHYKSIAKLIKLAYPEVTEAHQMTV